MTGGTTSGGTSGASAGGAGAANGGEAGASVGGAGAANGGEAGASEGGMAGADSTPLADVEAVVTCDNAYGFGWGNFATLNSYHVAPAAVTAGDIFLCGGGPEGYVIPGAEAPKSAYLYAVAWADHAVTQGLIGQFKRAGSTPIYTGDAHWQVCATGIDFDTLDPTKQGGPTTLQINQEIAKCNAGTGDPTTSSAGWVSATGAVTPGAVGKLAIGQDNSTAYNPDFPIVCPSGGTSPGVDTQARWMWYASDATADPFVFSSLTTSRPFLIFRLSTGALAP